MDAIKQILKKGEELLSGRRKKRIFKEIIVNAEALENRVAVLEDGQLEEFSHRADDRDDGLSPACSRARSKTWSPA